MTTFFEKSKIKLATFISIHYVDKHFVFLVITICLFCHCTLQFLMYFVKMMCTERAFIFRPYMFQFFWPDITDRLDVSVKVNVCCCQPRPIYQSASLWRAETQTHRPFWVNISSFHHVTFDPSAFYTTCRISHTPLRPRTTQVSTGLTGK